MTVYYDLLPRPRADTKWPRHGTDSIRHRMKQSSWNPVLFITVTIAVMEALILG